MGKHDILLATGNPGKAREMQEILGGDTAGIRWHLLDEFEAWPEPVEDADNFLDNATIKATYYARKCRLWTIADDSGLEVDVLGGEPGVRSARYAGEPRSDQANNRLLIENIRNIPADEWTARFRCCVVLSDGRHVLASAQGMVEGRIIEEPRGTNGFGYDPHFLVESTGLTAAEMTPDRKHAISHRGRALRQLRDRMISLICD